MPFLVFALPFQCLKLVHRSQTAGCVSAPAEPGGSRGFCRFISAGRETLFISAGRETLIGLPSPAALHVYKMHVRFLMQRGAAAGAHRGWPEGAAAPPAHQAPASRARMGDPNDEWSTELPLRTFDEIRCILPRTQNQHTSSCKTPRLISWCGGLGLTGRLVAGLVRIDTELHPELAGGGGTVGWDVMVAAWHMDCRLPSA